MEYKVQRADKSFDLEDEWDKGQWGRANAIELKNHMGTKPEHFPLTQAKLLYNEENIYVFFRINDRYVRAVAEKYHDSVCLDSCVEFFFTSGKDIGEGYFNLEANCGGTILFYHQTAKRQNQQQVTIEDCERIKIISSMPKIVDPEITEPTLWTIKYALPIDILKKYADVEIPGPGVIWKANFYKCADRTSHPHWLIWNPVDKPGPDFHCPQFFGNLAFR